MELSLADHEEYLLPIVVSSVLGAVVLILLVWYVIGGKRQGKDSKESPEPSTEDEPPEDTTAAEERRPKKPAKQFARKPSYSHALLAGTLKGHTGRILDTDFDLRGKYLLSCSEGVNCVSIGFFTSFVRCNSVCI